MNDLPFEWQEGELVEQAYVTIDGNKHYVTPATYSGSTSLSAFHLNKTEEETLKRAFGTILWTNPNPSSSFAEQTLTLSSSDYDVLEFVWRTMPSASGDILVDSSKTLKGYGVQLEYGSTAGNYGWVRRIVRLSDTTFSVWNAIKNNDLSITNEQCVPLYVIGYKTGLFGGQS